MTDSEIKTALKGAILNAKGYDSKVWSIEVYKLENTLDLINRLQAENERLVAECGNQSTLWSKHFENIFETAKETVKAEAYKEFAERLKENSIATFSWKGVVMVEEIDNLLKELVGEDK